MNTARTLLVMALTVAGMVTVAPIAAQAATPATGSTPAIDVQVRIGTGLAPYRPVQDVATPDDPFAESNDDCTISFGQEFSWGGSALFARGCGGIEIDAFLNGVSLPGDSSTWWNGGATGTVTRRYGCTDTTTGKRRVTLVRTAREDLDLGYRGSSVPAGEPGWWLPTVWVAPLEKISCRTGEQPMQYSIALCHLEITAELRGEVRRFLVAGSWSSKAVFPG